MRTFLLTLFWFVTALEVSRAEAMWSSYVKTNRYDFTVSDVALAETPVWREIDDQPPLAARKALRLARARLAELISDPVIWTLDKNFTLEKAGYWTLDTLSLKEQEGGHWVYLAVFEWIPPGGAIQGMPTTMTIPVLMSGVAVKPRVTPWPR